MFQIYFYINVELNFIFKFQIRLTFKCFGSLIYFKILFLLLCFTSILYFSLFEFYSSSLGILGLLNLFSYLLVKLDLVFVVNSVCILN